MIANNKAKNIGASNANSMAADASPLRRKRRSSLSTETLETADEGIEHPTMADRATPQGRRKNLGQIFGEIVWTVRRNPQCAFTPH
jgi:hypothetical protein